MSDCCCIDRFSWQNETLKELRAKIGMEETAKCLAASRQFVVVFGYPQCGKTEILLRFLDIKADCLKHVRQVLRAKQAQGTSSTSTAIMYHRSESDHWGIKKEYVDSKRNSAVRQRAKKDTMTKTLYCEEEKIIDKLAGVREQIEKYALDEIDSKILLHIYIPKKYFNSVQPEATDVIDFPGIDSSNKLEAKYVHNLAGHFLPLAKKILLIFESNRLTESGTIKVPGLDGLHWTDLPELFVIIPTRVYTTQQENCIDKYKSSEDFPVSLVDSCIRELRKTNNFDDSLKLNIYPVEVGDSLENLQTHYNKWCKMPEDFYDRIRLENDKQLEAIRFSATSGGRVSQPLVSIAYFKSWLEKKCEKRLKLFEKECDDEKKNKDECEKHKNLCEETKKNRTVDYEKLREKYNNDSIECDDVIPKSKEKMKRFEENLNEWLSKEINSVAEFDDDGKQNELLGKISCCVKNSEVDKVYNKLFQECNGAVMTCKLKQFADYLTKEDKNSFRKIFKRRGFFKFWTRSDKEDVCKNLTELIVKKLQVWHVNSIEQPFFNLYEKWKDKKNEEIQKLKERIKLCNSLIVEYDRDIESSEETIKKIKQKIENICNFLNEAKIAVDSWEEIGMRCFCRQKNDLINIINSAKSESKRMSAFCLLCNIIIDYETLIKK